MVPLFASKVGWFALEFGQCGTLNGLLGHVLADPCAFRAKKAIQSWITVLNEREVVCLSALQNHKSPGTKLYKDRSYVLLDVT